MTLEKNHFTSLEKTIHERALLVARGFRTAQADLLGVIAQVDRSKLFRKLGYRSSFDYCVRELGLSEDLTFNFLGVARKSESIPELALAVQEGLAISKARKILPVLKKENAAEWLVRAKELNYRQLERAVAEASPESPRIEKSKPQGPALTKLELSVGNEVMAAFRHAQDLLSSKWGRAATLEETLAAVSGQYIDRNDPVKKAERAKSPGVIQQVQRRDQGQCQVRDGRGHQCDQKRWLDIHHIQPKSEGGPDTVDNLITVCAAHHRLLHPPQDGAIASLARGNLRQ